jgi:hypothetical protein
MIAAKRGGLRCLFAPGCALAVGCWAVVPVSAQPAMMPGIGQQAEPEETESQRVARERRVREEAVLDSVGRLESRFADEFVLLGVRDLVERSHASFVAGDYEPAAAFAGLAMKVARENDRDRPIDALYNRGAALQEARAYAEAERVLRTVVAMPMESDRDRRIGAAASIRLGLLRLEDADRAAELELSGLDPLARILEPEPESGWRAYADAVNFVIDGYSAAAEHFARALELRPDDARAKRNLQIARLRAGELVRTLYEARREFEDALAAIIRPQELIRETARLAEEQGAAADATRDRERGLRGATPEDFRVAAERSSDEQTPINADTSELFQRAGVTRELLQTRLAGTDPVLVPLLTDLVEEFELGLRDAVESQRWSVYEFDAGDVREGRELQQQAERDLLAVLEKLRRNAQNFQNQAQQQQQQRDQQAEQQRQQRQEPRDVEDNQQRSYEGEQAERDRNRRIEQLLEREEEDLERVRRADPQRDQPVEEDW